MNKDHCCELHCAGQAIEIKYASWSKAGADPYGRVKNNQDSSIAIASMGDDNVSLFGVFDGHGVDGAKVSQTMVQNLPKMLSSSEEFKAQDYAGMFQQHMPRFNKYLKANNSINTQLSGSTAVTALLDSSGLLTVANVGDSRCVLGRMREGLPSAVSLTTDHNPDVASEAARIIACQGRIRPYIHEGQYVGPKRVWIRNKECPGLAMTRCFGDELGATVGVIAEPDIVQAQLTPEDKYLVLYSDGIYEFMDNDYIMSIVHHQATRGWPPSDVAKCLVAEANRQWMEQEDGIVDDCTVIVVYLNVQMGLPIQAARASSSDSDTSTTSDYGPGIAGNGTSVSKTLAEVARRSSDLLTPKDFMLKCNIEPAKK